MGPRRLSKLDLVDQQNVSHTTSLDAIAAVAHSASRFLLQQVHLPLVLRHQVTAPRRHRLNRLQRRRRCSSRLQRRPQHLRRQSERSSSSLQQQRNQIRKLSQRPRSDGQNVGTALSDQTREPLRQGQRWQMRAAAQISSTLASIEVPYFGGLAGSATLRSTIEDQQWCIRGAGRLWE